MQTDTKSIDGEILSPINCMTLKIVSIYFVVCMFLSVAANSYLVFKLISRYKCQKNATMRTKMIPPFNRFLLTLTIINLIATACVYPIVAISNYSCK